MTIRHQPPRPSHFESIAGIKLFAARIIYEAVEAYRAGDLSAGMFFYTPRFERLATGLNLDIYEIRGKLGLPLYEKLEAAPRLNEDYAWIMLSVVDAPTIRKQKKRI